jgi:hypothetical protein
VDELCNSFNSGCVHLDNHISTSPPLAWYPCPILNFLSQPITTKLPQTGSTKVLWYMICSGRSYSQMQPTQQTLNNCCFCFPAHQRAQSSTHSNKQLCRSNMHHSCWLHAAHACTKVVSWPHTALVLLHLLHLQPPNCGNHSQAVGRGPGAGKGPAVTNNCSSCTCPKSCCCCAL